nr:MULTISPECIES: DUF943 family protein [unclassified Pantoea]
MGNEKIKVKNKPAIFILSLFSCLLLAYVFWLLLRPAEIVAVHKNGNHSYVLVKNFPFTDKERIDWWQENKSMLKNSHGVPAPDNDGYFTVVFWDFGDGYKEEGKYDRLCFEDMKPPVNCIAKDKILTVRYGRNIGLSFTTNNNVYRLKNNGKIVKDRVD